MHGIFTFRTSFQDSSVQWIRAEFMYTIQFDAALIYMYTHLYRTSGVERVYFVELEYFSSPVSGCQSRAHRYVPRTNRLLMTRRAYWKIPERIFRAKRFRTISIIITFNTNYIHNYWYNDSRLTKLEFLVELITENRCLWACVSDMFNLPCVCVFENEVRRVFVATRKKKSSCNNTNRTLQ